MVRIARVVAPSHPHHITQRDGLTRAVTDTQRPTSGMGPFRQLCIQRPATQQNYSQACGRRGIPGNIQRCANMADTRAIVYIIAVRTSFIKSKNF